jgi:uncharacterized membrane protein YeaQ/YmgE (transglycosylase-associated protein family)
VSLETVLICIATGLISGWLASGVVGDIVIGIVGPLLGGLIVRSLSVHSPIGGLAGTISSRSSARPRCSWFCGSFARPVCVVCS